MKSRSGRRRKSQRRFEPHAVAQGEVEELRRSGGGGEKRLKLHFVFVLNTTDGQTERVWLPERGSFCFSRLKIELPFFRGVQP